MNIDWSKAPEGATHYDASTYRVNSFMKLEDYTWFYWPPESPDPKWIQWGKTTSYNVADMIERPKQPTWLGPQDGPPPVGVVCEFSVRGGDWIRGDIRYLSANTCVIGGENEEHVYHPFIISFRAARTPEQIAAEEREKAAIAMSQATQGAKDWMEAFRMLHDAGFTKQVNP
jgi:hypothetical protein